uniref:Uncharacterized protein n=1 Tax=Rhizophora mucronata TaxID=61149 RepID=A0A2P2R1N6_RHIMU
MRLMKARKAGVAMGGWDWADWVVGMAAGTVAEGLESGSIGGDGADIVIVAWFGFL